LLKQRKRSMLCNLAISETWWINSNRERQPPEKASLMPTS
jgi:hypothetical protein